jgi:hypothetical protein
MAFLTRPETVVAELLDQNTPLILSTNLFSGPPRPWSTSSVPRNAVFAYSMMSFRPSPYIGSQKLSHRDVRINIFIRQQQDQFRVGSDLTRTIWSTLQMADVSAYTGYITCLMAESDAQYIGLSDVDDHRWMMTARVLYKG